MTPDQMRQLAELLARLVADGEITEEQAAAIALAAKDLSSDAIRALLPLPPYFDGRPYAQPDDHRKIALILLGLAAGFSSYTIGRAATRPAGSPIPGPRVRIALANSLQDWHQAQATSLAADLAAGRLTVAEWQSAMGAITRQYMTAAAQLGAGANVGMMAGAIDDAMITQAAYLARFADQIAAGIVIGEPYSEAYLAARSRMYAGQGRALFFQAQETAGSSHADDPAGWIVQYIAQDDNSTCSPCHNAQGYYLPGAGPMPGDVCLGAGNCRCERVEIYDPAIYAQLTGSATP